MISYKWKRKITLDENNHEKYSKFTNKNDDYSSYSNRAIVFDTFVISATQKKFFYIKNIFQFQQTALYHHIFDAFFLLILPALQVS